MDWLTGLTKFFLDLLINLWNSFVGFLDDFWIRVADQILQAISSTVLLIPVPGFLDSVSLSLLFSSLPSSVLFFLSFLNLPSAFALISSAVTFRLIRKLVTLFQW
jgi:hypothetical protein